MQIYQTNPLHKIILARGEGSTVWDTSGKPYVDLLAGVWCSVLGHGHPRWKKAVQEQTARLTHVGAAFFTVEIEAALSKLAEIVPPKLNRAVFLNTGSEAVELAFKMARAATGSDRVAVIQKGFYGATAYTMALSEIGLSSPYLPKVDGVYRLPIPSGHAHEDWACLAPLREIAERGEQLAAVIYEPVMGVGGILVPPEGYGAQLRELASRCGALFIAEEVTTGVGRTGRWFGFEYDGIVPDILVIGKAIGGGLPVSAVVTTAEVEARCQGVLRHVQSHQNDPFSGRIAAEVITILQDEHLLEAVNRQGDYLRAGLEDLQTRCECIQEIRGRGLMVGVELAEDYAANGPAIIGRLLDAGFILDFQPQAATFRLFPPYVISSQEIDAFLVAFEQVLRSAES
jgi:2,2-dialkylglycine decarboxylase (pyruvate)